MKIILLALSLLLAACSSRSHVATGSIEKIKAKNGVILVSATRNYDFMGGSKPGGLVAKFRFVNVETGAAMEILSEGLLVKNSRIQRIHRDDDQTGQILVFQLPPGKYRLASWGLAADLGINVGNVESDPGSLPQVTFKVERGKITYAGNYHLNVLRQGSFFNITMASGAVFSCEDKAERDIMALRDNRPEVSQLKILNQQCTVAP